MSGASPPQTATDTASDLPSSPTPSLQPAQAHRRAAHRLYAPLRVARRGVYPVALAATPVAAPLLPPTYDASNAAGGTGAALPRGGRETDSSLRERVARASIVPDAGPLSEVPFPAMSTTLEEAFRVAQLANPSPVLTTASLTIPLNDSETRLSSQSAGLDHSESESTTTQVWSPPQPVVDPEIQPDIQAAVKSFEDARDRYYNYGHFRSVLLSGRTHSTMLGRDGNSTAGVSPSNSAVISISAALETMSQLKYDNAPVKQLMKQTSQDSDVSVTDTLTTASETPFDQSYRVLEQDYFSRWADRQHHSNSHSHSDTSRRVTWDALSTPDARDSLASPQYSDTTSKPPLADGSFKHLSPKSEFGLNRFSPGLRPPTIDQVGYMQVDRTTGGGRLKSVSSLPSDISERQDSNSMIHNPDDNDVDPDRKAWQTMLLNVLSGEVLRMETSRFNIEIDSSDRNQRIWLEIRAYLRGKSVPEEVQRIKEKKLETDNIFKDLLKFKVDTGNEYASVKEILDRVESVEMLYPNLKALVKERPVYESPEFKGRLSALYSWILLTNIVRNQLTLLSRGELSVSERRPSGNAQGLETHWTDLTKVSAASVAHAETNFEHVDIQKSYKEGALALFIKLLKKIRIIVEESFDTWKRIGLKANEADIIRLVAYVPNFIKGFIELRITTAEKCKFVGAGLDAFIDDFSSLFELGISAKQKFMTEIGTQSKSWTFGNGITPEYEMALRRSFEAYFNLIIWRLNSGTDYAFCKEIDLIDFEWQFTRRVAGCIEHGDSESADRIVALVLALMQKLLSFVESSSSVKFDGIAQTEKSIKSVTRMLEILKTRVKVMVEFYNKIYAFFSNSVEFDFDQSYLRRFAMEGYTWLKTTAYPSRMILASPQTPVDVAISCLTKTFTDEHDGHIIIVPIRRAKWHGRHATVKIEYQPEFALQTNRLRVVASSSKHLPALTEYYEKAFKFSNRSEVPRPHLSKIDSHLADIRLMITKLGAALIQACSTFVAACKAFLERTRNVVKHDALETLSLTGSKPSNDRANEAMLVTAVSFSTLVEDIFSFVGDAVLSMASIHLGKNDCSMIRSGVRLASVWNNFIIGIRDDIPHEKLVPWAVQSLQFMMNVTSGQRMNSVSSEDFDELRQLVSQSMSILLKSFDGGRNPSELVDPFSTNLGLNSIMQKVKGIASPTVDSTISITLPGTEEEHQSASADTTEDSGTTGVDNSSSQATPLKDGGSADSSYFALQVRNPLRPRSKLLDISELTTVEVDAIVMDPAENIRVSVSSDGGSPNAMSDNGAVESGRASGGQTIAPVSTVGLSEGTITPDKRFLTPTSGRRIKDGSRPTSSGSERECKSASKVDQGSELLFKQRKWLRSIQELEAERERRFPSVAGKVLDSTKIADRNIGILARASSSISLRWQQGKFLGGGSFGNVYLGINLDTSEVMAVKEIRFTDVTNLEKLQQSITDEMEVLRVLHHKNVIEYYGVEVYRDRTYIFMEYCPYSISGILEGGRFENEDLVRILTKQMLQGFEYLHERGVVHRDVKPANILIGQEFNIKIVDFGASKILKAQKTVVAVNGTNNTLVGTPHYIAPEIITNDELGRAGLQDIWSLGCCVLEMVTGKKPWAQLDNEWAIMYNIGIAGKIPMLPDESLSSTDCIDFLKKCFTRPAKTRPSATELLQHPWIASFDESTIDVSAEIRLIADTLPPERGQPSTHPPSALPPVRGNIDAKVKV